MNFNRINHLIFAVVLSCFVTLIISGFVDYLYFKDNSEQKRGFSIEVTNLDQNSFGSAVGKVIELGFLMAEANIEDGKKVSTRCALCHTFNKGEPHKVGANLWNVVGEIPATKTGFDYSAAMKANKEKWTIERLAVYLYAPQKTVPGTKMSFAGVKNEKELASLLVYLASLNDNKIAIPGKDIRITVG